MKFHRCVTQEYAKRGPAFISMVGKPNRPQALAQNDDDDEEEEDDTDDDNDDDGDNDYLTMLSP